MSGSSGGPSGGGIKGKDGTVRGGTKGGRVYVKTERAGSDAKSNNVPSGGKPVPALRGVGTQVGGIEGRIAPRDPGTVAKRGAGNTAVNAPSNGSRGVSNSSSNASQEVGRSSGTIKSGSPAEGMKDVGSGKSAGARGANALPAPETSAKTAPETSSKSSGFAALLGRIGRLGSGIGAAATVMEPSETNAGEKEWLAKNKGANASMGVTSPSEAPKKAAPAPERKEAPAAKKAAPAPAKKAPASAPAKSGLSEADKMEQLVKRGFSREDAANLAGAKGGKVTAPAGFAKGGMVSKPKPAAAPKPSAPKPAPKPASAPKAAASKAPAKAAGMPRMPKMPATGKAAMASKMAAIMKPKKS